MPRELREHIEKIVPLTDEEFAFVFSHFRRKSFKKRDFIIREGQNVPDSYFVVSGLLMLVYNDKDAKQHIVSFAMEDWWESDYLAYHTQTKATLSLQCLEPTEVYCLSLEGYKKVCAGLHKMEHFFLQKANSGHLAAQRRIMSFLTFNAQERYEQFLQRYPALSQRVSKSLIASYLGVSRETLSRLWRST